VDGGRSHAAVVPGARAGGRVHERHRDAPGWDASAHVRSGDPVVRGPADPGPARRRHLPAGSVARGDRSRDVCGQARHVQGGVRATNLGEEETERTMPRPGFVLEVDERTPPLIVHEGEGYRMQKFPLGTRVVYPPDALPGVRDLNAHIRHALLNPVGDSKPLPDLLFAGMKLTIAVDDISIPLPPMVTPDIRQRILEHVIELAARAGVDDLEIVVATALHRRM